MSSREARFSAHGTLIAVAVGGSVVEVVAVHLSGLSAATGLAPQLTAPAPFGVFHDVRWLLVFHPSWLGFVLEALALLAFRGGLTAVMLREAWPKDAERPPFRTFLLRGTAFTTVLAVLVSPWAALLFAQAVLPVSWLMFVGLPTTAFLALLLHHGVVTPQWWRGLPPPRSVGWIAFTLLVLTVSATVITTTPFPAAVLAAALTGLFNAWAWQGICRVLVHRDHPRRRIPLTPLGVGAVVLLVVGGTFLGFEFARTSSEVSSELRAAGSERGRPVLLVTGFGSSWDGEDEPFSPEYRARRFSYRGSAADGGPLPYEAAATHAALGVLVERIEEQVEAFAREAGRPVSIVAESEGSLVAKVYVSTRPEAPVEKLVLLSPLLGPGRVYYPPRGSAGWGVAGGWELRGLAAVLEWVASFELPPDGAFVRSVLDNASALRDVMGCSVPGVEQTVIFPLADAVAAPYTTAGGVRVAVVPEFHGGLLSEGDVRRGVLLELRGLDLPSPKALEVANLAIRGAASAWQVPTLPPAAESRLGPRDRRRWTRRPMPCPTGRPRRAPGPGRPGPAERLNAAWRLRVRDGSDEGPVIRRRGP